jgi:hypothetical protein
MKSFAFYRWCSRNHRLVTLIWLVPLSLLLIYNAILNEDALINVMLSIVLLAVLLWAFLFVSHRAVLNEAVRLLNQDLDARLLLEITTEQLSFIRDKRYRAILQIDRCVALREMGQLEQVKTELTGLALDDNKRLPPAVRLIYLNNQADLSAHLGDWAGATAWMARWQACLATVKQAKLRRYLEKMSGINQAQLLIHQQEWAEARRLLADLEDPKQKRQQISIRLLQAKICLQTGDVAEAERLLSEVIHAGGRLIDGLEARTLLDELRQVASVSARSVGTPGCVQEQIVYDESAVVSTPHAQ